MNTDGMGYAWVTGDAQRCDFVFIMLVNVKLPTIVSIFTLMSLRKFMLSWLSKKKFLNLGVLFAKSKTHHLAYQSEYVYQMLCRISTSLLFARPLIKANVLVS